jgi:hypothetical protein
MTILTPDWTKVKVSGIEVFDKISWFHFYYILVKTRHGDNWTLVLGLGV